MQSNDPITVERPGMYQINVMNDRNVVGQFVYKIEEKTIINDEFVNNTLILRPKGKIVKYQVIQISAYPAYRSSPLWKAINE
jgi:hypothetical protein